MNERLSLDILNFVPIENAPFISNGKMLVSNLSHLIDHQRKDFYTFEQIRQKVKTKNFMQYYSLLSSIPKHIKKQIRENLTDCVNTFNPEDIFLERIKNNKDIKFVYISLVNNTVHIPTQKFLKWEEKLQCDIPNWFIYFNILRKCCKNVYLINFQYKFLHRVIPTNTFLFQNSCQRQQILLILQCRR